MAAEEVVHYSQDQWVDPPHVQDTEPHVAPDGQTSMLPAAIIYPSATIYNHFWHKKDSIDAFEWLAKRTF